MAADAGLFHLAEHWIGSRTIGVRLDRFAHRPIRPPGHAVLIKRVANLVERSSAKPSLECPHDLLACPKSVPLVVRVELEPLADGRKLVGQSRRFADGQPGPTEAYVLLFGTDV